MAAEEYDGRAKSAISASSERVYLTQLKVPLSRFGENHSDKMFLLKRKIFSPL